MLERTTARFSWGWRRLIAVRGQRRWRCADSVLHSVHGAKALHCLGFKLCAYFYISNFASSTFKNRFVFADYHGHLHVFSPPTALSTALSHVSRRRPSSTVGSGRKQRSIQAQCRFEVAPSHRPWTCIAAGKSLPGATSPQRDTTVTATLVPRSRKII